MPPLVFLLILAISSGQLIKIPLVFSNGPTLLDLLVLSFSIFGLAKLNLKKTLIPTPIKLGLLFFLVSILSLILTPIPLTLNQFLVSILYPLRFLSILTFITILVNGGLEDIKKNIQKIIVYSAIIISISGLLQLIFFPNLEFLELLGWDPHFLRLSSTFLDPNFTGSFLVLSFITFILAPQPLPKKIKLTISILLLISIILTFSRSTYLALTIALLSLSIIKKNWKILFIAISLLVISLIIFYSQDYLANLKKPVNRNQSAALRLNNWEYGITLFKNHPLFGVGFNTYRYALNYYQLAPNYFITGHSGATNDSSLLFVLSTTGLVGLLTYLAFLTSLFIEGFKSYRSKNPYGDILIVCLVALIAQSFLLNTLFYPAILFSLLLIFSKLFQK